MAFILLDNLLSALSGNVALSAMVDAKIYKNKPLEKSDVDLRNATNKSLISCEAQDIFGQLVASDPIFAVDIRSRKGTDGGAEYCAEIADAVRTILDDGFSGVEVLKIQGDVVFDKNLAAYRCRLEVYCHVKISYALTLTPSIASSQVAGTEIIFTATATPAQGLEYRFFVTGPGTGFAARDMTGWQTRNSFAWMTCDQDVGISTITVQVRGGISKGAADQSTTTHYTVTAADSVGTAPTITSLVPRLASPQPPGIEIDIICTASSPDGNELQYKFWHQPPGASYWKDLSFWITQNWIRWKPKLADSGTNSIRVDVIDGKHAGKGSYDARTTISFTVAP
jgi:hypothetical protein